MTTKKYSAVIKVVGVGGAGVNVVNRMIESGLRGVEFIAVNTDAQVLLLSDADVKLDIGRELTGGLGAGSDPEVGRKAAEEHIADIEAALADATMVFIAAGEGGGTGTGASPVIARIARNSGALTVGVVTRPFGYEGRRRLKQANEGINLLKEEVDALIAISNERLLSIAGEDMLADEMYKLSDFALLQDVQAITEIILKTGFSNVDFRDVSTVMKDSGTALIGIGTAKGEDRAIKATEQAISSPLLESSIEGASAVIFCLFGNSKSLSGHEIAQSARLIEETVHPDANIIDGLYYDDTLDEEVTAIVIATGFPESNVPSASAAQSAGEKSDPLDAIDLSSATLSDDDILPASGSSTSIPAVTSSTKLPHSGSFDSSSIFTSSSFSRTDFKAGDATSGSLAALSGEFDAISNSIKLPDSFEDSSVSDLDVPEFMK